MEDIIARYFAGRHTVRTFDNSKPITDDDLTRLLTLAAQAPNTGNMQLYSAIVSTEKAQLKALCECHFNQPASTGAPAIVTFCADKYRFEKWCKYRNANPGFDNLQGFMWSVIDTAIFAQQFCTLAELNGMGTCYLGTTTFNAGKIAEILNLPTGVVPVISVAVGYPAQPQTAKPTERILPKGYIHLGSYHDPGLSDIDEIFNPVEATEDAKRFTAENSLENLAQVFTNIRYPKETNEHFSEIYADFLGLNWF